MTDPKTAARAVATRLAEREISIKHVQALDLVAAGCGFQDRSKLTDLAELPVLKRVNRRLLESVATVLARHDLARRATIVDVTTTTLIPNRTIDMRTVREGGERMGEGASKGVIPFMKMHMDAILSVSQGGKYREAIALHHPATDAEVVSFVSQRPGISAYLNEQSCDGPWIIVSNPDGQPSDPWSFFWSENDGWGGFPEATVYADRTSPLPEAETRSSAAVRWMNVEDAAFRAAVDMAIVQMDRDEPDMDFDPDVPGERMLDYDRIAAMIALSKVFVHPLRPIEIAVRDGAQRASLYVASLSEDPDTASGQVREWVRDVEHEFRGGLAPTEDRLRELLIQGNDAIGGIRTWIETDDRLWAWMNVSSYPGAIDATIDPEGSGVTEGIDMKPLEQVLAGLKAQFEPNTVQPTPEDELAARNGIRVRRLATALMSLRGFDGEPERFMQGYMTRCPNHDDTIPSLMVQAADDGTVSMKCLAGCDAAEVEKAVEQELAKITGNAKLRNRSADQQLLDDLRDIAAQARFEAHRFPATMVVSETDGWGWTTPGEEWTRTVFLETNDPQPGDESETVTYVVQFDPGTDQVNSSYAITGNGNLVGHAIDPELTARLDLGNGLGIEISAVCGELPIALSPGIDDLIGSMITNVYHSKWDIDGGLSKETAVAIASSAIANLRGAGNEEEREAARREAVAEHLPPQEASVSCWHEVRTEARSMIDSIDSAIEDLVDEGVLEEEPDYDKDELESVLMDKAFARLDRDDTSTWRDSVKGNAVVEIYLHLLPEGDSVEETCTIGHPHLLPENVVVDDQFRFVLSRLGITGKAWRMFAKPKDVEPYKARFKAMRSEPLIEPDRLGVMIENGCTRNFLVSLYCQAPLTDVLDLDLSKPIAFEKVRLAVVDVMSGTFHDERLEGVVEMTDGVDGLLTTSDCGPYASQTDDLVSSAYYSRIGSSEAISRGPAATAELDAHLAVEGLRRSQPGERVAWRETDSEGGPIVLEADVYCLDVSHTYGLRSVKAVFEDCRTTRPEITIGRRR